LPALAASGYRVCVIAIWSIDPLSLCRIRLSRQSELDESVHPWLPPHARPQACAYRHELWSTWQVSENGRNCCRRLGRLYAGKKLGLGGPRQFWSKIRGRRHYELGRGDIYPVPDCRRLSGLLFNDERDRTSILLDVSPPIDTARPFLPHMICR
jgi:hypothetical protein